MRRPLAIALAAAAFHACGALAADSLVTRVTESDGWVAWNVPMIADAGVPCCYAGNDHGAWTNGCDLDGHDHGFSTSDHPRPPADDTLTVYAHVAHARVDDVRAYASSCPVRSRGAVRRLEGATAPDSIALLSSWADAADAKRDGLVLAAIAYHDDPSATRVLASRAEPSHARKQREDALFWLGEARGIDGAAIVERYATTDGDPKLREQAIFALSQSHAGDPYERILAIAGSDPAEHVRSQALFWMAQMHDARAERDITAAVASDASKDVREQAVFALSQLGEGNADDALIALLQGNYPREVKKQALFWLGQSGSPRAMKFFDQALTKSQ